MAETIAATINAEWDGISATIKKQMQSRGVRAANELRNASQLVLRGQRHGRKYIVPGTGRMKYYKKTKKAKITYKYYTASAPGEPPAVRTGAYRMSWQPTSFVEGNGTTYQYEVHAQAYSKQRTDNGKYLLGEILEEGKGRIKPRPHQEQILERALPKIKKIYSEPYV